CVTSVPDTASVIKIGPEAKSIDETGIKWIVSPYDEYALEEALQLTEAKGGEVTAITYGPARAEAALRDCLARGAHKAVHVLGGEATLGDSFTIAKVLAKALEGRDYDLVLCGFKGVGTDNGQVGPMLAELLGIPHVANVTKLEVGDGSLKAGRDVEGGQEQVSSPLPALLTCQKGLNEPRYAALKGIMAAKRKPVDKVEVASLGIDEGADPFYVRRSLELPPPKSGGTIIQGEDDPAGAAAQLVNLLRTEAKAI
ncbi:MAG TPA: electron transfer flavoprotein subunit beta/FixA family protein, partial [Candidatus Sulfomarinibacteraceae bacterium]|nr:electron transfer flavoprotein subunit beta/FixA family protein [Candidatus Sulfomarinibacteraceae bacterium]